MWCTYSGVWQLIIINKYIHTDVVYLQWRLATYNNKQTYTGKHTAIAQQLPSGLFLFRWREGERGEGNGGLVDSGRWVGREGVDRNLVTDQVWLLS